MKRLIVKHVVEAILIFIFGGFMNMVVFCTGCLDEPYLFSKTFFINLSYSGISWVAYWKGSEFIVNFWDERIPWLKKPLRRFLTSLVSIVIYVFIAVWGIDLFFDLVIFKKTLSKALASSSAPFSITLLITLGINVFMHGRGFLIAWRQAAIDVEKLKTEQISSQYNSLKNQVNPHFLFNSLNALSSLVYDNQDKAVEFIRKLSQVYRYVLESMDEEIVPIGKEMDFVQNFIFLQKIRFGDNLLVNFNNAEPNRYVPPLAIQLLVENAIKHNVISEKDPLSINIEINDSLCIVSNSLKEKKVKDSTGIGLANIKSRYHYLTDKEINIEKTEDSFQVTIPLLNLKNEVHNN